MSGRRGVYDKVDTGEDMQDLADDHRYGSFAAPTQGNDAKWFVDGCGYFWAVSVALEEARESVYILDWWLSPELYLRRPPSKNEQYRLDRMLKAAAERGCKIHIIVYKEITQAMSLASAHTKHALEDLHPNISVFRHPDHLPDAETIGEGILQDFKETDFSIADIAKLPAATVKRLFGMDKETVLFWAHHEKLVIVDNKLGFMGGLDLCFGRWDTNQHSIADVHPQSLDAIVFPGQDYNNARIYDFQDLSHWQNNKLDRTKNSRMGWSDLSICLTGPAVIDLRRHFTQRWNFIYEQKYRARPDRAYERLPDVSSSLVDPVVLQHKLNEAHKYGLNIMSRFTKEIQKMRQGEYESLDIAEGEDSRTEVGAESSASLDVQVLRSCAKWSHGTALERSIQEAYIETIHDSQHFVYIENQFFIMATEAGQRPVENQIGAAIVERILRADRNQERFKIIVVIPAIPGFTGDLRADESLSTRAIMQYQYESINRGKHSIYQKLAEQKVDASRYISFYNLRNYDRINAGLTLRQVEQESGVSYEEARKEHDDCVGAGFGGKGEETGVTSASAKKYELFQKATSSAPGEMKEQWDSVASCYMLGGKDIRDVPWAEGDMAEIDAFVSEELYIHSKLLIADDRVVICGSANLNDRSQLGSHDSEIAVRIDGGDTVESRIDGQPWQAARFASSLRRQLFRKHLGLLPPQDMAAPDDTFLPLAAGNAYDWDSAEDRRVEDPLSDAFTHLWTECAKANTEAFARVFHPVPVDSVTTWAAYDAYYERFFHEDKVEPASRGKWGHVVTEDFAPGAEGIAQVKEILSTIRGTLVEMPLHFLEDEDIAKHGLKLNELTETLYT